MNGATTEGLFQQGRQAATRGDLEKAYQLFVEATDSDAGHEEAWLWRAITAPNDAETAFCLRRTLEINPNNVEARGWLERVADSSLIAGTLAPSSAPPEPLVTATATAPAVLVASSPPLAVDSVQQTVARAGPPAAPLKPPSESKTKARRSKVKAGGSSAGGKLVKPLALVAALAALAVLAVTFYGQVGVEDFNELASPALSDSATVLYAGYAGAGLVVLALLCWLGLRLLRRQQHNGQPNQRAVPDRPSRRPSNRHDQAKVRGANIRLRAQLINLNLLPPDFNRPLVTRNALYLLLIIVAGVALFPRLYDARIEAESSVVGLASQLAAVKVQVDRENARVAGDKAEATRLDEETKRLKDEIAQTAARSAVQLRLLRQFALAPAVDTVLVSQPAGLQLTSVNWQEPKLTVRGRASNLQLVMAYTAALQASGRFTELNLHLLDEVADQSAASRPSVVIPPAPGTPVPAPPPPATIVQLSFELELGVAPGGGR